ncbi:MAG: C10 family peptidase [Bacteroidaceae bacterium]|nr:C10 family peptidase [Bacteroidaceae bacterium]
MDIFKLNDKLLFKNLYMKIIHYSFITLVILLYSCSKNEIDNVSYPVDNGIKHSSISNQITSNNVNMTDIMNVIERSSHQSKSTVDQVVVTPYIRAESDTLMYIVNYGNGHGWKIFSSDKRTPAILAEGEEGYFSLEEGSPSLSFWMSCVADDIARVRNSTDEELTFSDEEICFNKAYWTGDYPRFNGHDEPIIPIGHWEEIVYSETVEYDHVDHMVAKWYQQYPYNECCPYYINIPNTRAVAGCVAIAGSQMLYYLHNKIGVPIDMYSEGSCVGNINNYAQNFSNPSSSVWSSMSMTCPENITSMIPEAILIGYVGLSVNMHYCEIGQKRFSWAIPSNLKTNVFENLGISCSHGDYDENIVKSSLLNQMPVIVSASDLLVPLDGDIHCFVIDGYRRTCTRYTHYHYYVVDVEPPGPYMVPEEYNTYTYSNIQLTNIKINWGWPSQWGDSHVNDGWYTLTGSWSVINGNDPCSYDHYRKMIYGFSVSE